MTLDLYIARRFLGSFLRVFGVFFGVLTLIDLIEQIRRFSQNGIGVAEALVLAVLNVPQNMYLILPLVMVLAGITLFLGLAKSSELVVVRAAGRSGLRPADGRRSWHRRAAASPRFATWLCASFGLQPLSSLRKQLPNS